mmetsp:Transcript_19265/g.39801  ORF Transcript_19265/g.39801 Transcript_19265/m.39801 type:complete len:185 (+) Transcript_19265:116-670(+)
MAPNRVCTTALVLLVSLPSALASLMNGAGCDTTTNFDIDTVLSSAQAYGNSENVFMPPGCTCKESGVAKPECVIFDCDCKCDLTAGVCDMNCCCDTECTAAQITKFSTNCLDSGVSDPVYQTCHSPYEVAKINPNLVNLPPPPVPRPLLINLPPPSPPERHLQRDPRFRPCLPALHSMVRIPVL